LSFYLTPFLPLPIAHFVTKPSLIDSIDKALMHTSRRFPGCIGFHTSAQAETFSNIPSAKILGGGIEVAKYPFNSQGEDVVGWVGRIAPEKGLEDAVQAASVLNLSLRVIGKLEDSEYWRYIIERYPDASVQYLGFLEETKFRKELGKLKALILTHRWVEPLGTVALQALACGVPVVSYRRGGPIEIIEDEKTGFLTKPDDISELCTALRKVDSLSRRDCRTAVERSFTFESFCSRVESWLYDVIESRKEFETIDAVSSSSPVFPQRRG
jgi:UDP-glucose:tetrahydrobiopterin glucosyltransferase